MPAPERNLDRGVELRVVGLDLIGAVPGSESLDDLVYSCGILDRLGVRTELRPIGGQPIIDVFTRFLYQLLSDPPTGAERVCSVFRVSA